MSFDTETIKAKRMALGLSARQFGIRIGVDSRTVRRYEAADCEPSITVAGRMAHVLGIPLDSLYVHDAAELSGTAEAAKQTHQAPETASVPSDVGAVPGAR